MTEFLRLENAYMRLLVILKNHPLCSYRLQFDLEVFIASIIAKKGKRKLILDHVKFGAKYYIAIKISLVI